MVYVKEDEEICRCRKQNIVVLNNILYKMFQITILSSSATLFNFICDKIVMISDINNIKNIIIKYVVAPFNINNN